MVSLTTDLCNLFNTQCESWQKVAVCRYLWSIIYDKLTDINIINCGKVLNLVNITLYVKFKCKMLLNECQNIKTFTGHRKVKALDPTSWKRSPTWSHIVCSIFLALSISFPPHCLCVEQHIEFENCDLWIQRVKANVTLCPRSKGCGALAAL